MKEVICIHVGHAGVEMGASLWNQLCIEHGIQQDSGSSLVSGNEKVESYFHPTSRGRYVPRAVFVDTDPDSIDEVKKKKMMMFTPDQFLCGREDSGNNFARGYFVLGRDMIESVEERLRFQAEKCSNIEGVIVGHSFGGGTGSGLGSLLLEHVGVDYRNKIRLQCGIFPSKVMAAAMVEPYNTTLALHSTLRHSSCTMLFENEVIRDTCRENLEIEYPTYVDLNRIVSLALSSITASSRFKAPLGMGLYETLMNLVPQERLHFPVISYGPSTSLKTSEHQVSLSDIPNECFNAARQMINCNVKKGKTMACCMVYRGDLSLTDINMSVSELKRKKAIKFVRWCHPVYKISACKKSNKDQLSQLNPTFCLLNSSTAIGGDVFGRLIKKFDLMMAKKAFTHWYISEGMDECEFLEAKQDILDLEGEYREAQLDL